VVFGWDVEPPPWGGVLVSVGVWELSVMMDAGSMVVRGDGLVEAGRDDIPKMTELIRNGADIVIGSRFISDGNRVLFYRRIGMKVLDFATGLAGGVETTDSQSGFRAYSRRAVEEIKPNMSPRLLLQAKELGLKIAEVPITCRYDQGKSSQNPLTHGLSVLTARNGVYTLQHYLDTGSLPFGPTILLLTPGTLSPFSGIILHTMTRILKEIQKQ